MKHSFLKYGTQRTRKVFFLISIFLLYATSSLVVHAQGTVWEHVYSNPLESLGFHGVTCSDTRFVAIGSDRINYTSPDGLKWKAENQVPTAYFAIAYGNGKFVAVGYKGSLITSSDGINWTSKNTGVTSNFNRNGVVYAPDKNWFVAVALEGQMAVSKDGGSTFTKHVLVGSKANGIAYGNGRFVMAGGMGSVYYSDDAVNWTSKTIGVNHLMCAAYGSGNFVAAGKNDVYSSPDGANWNKRATISSAYFHGITYTDFAANNMFVLVGETLSGSSIPLYTSPDGTSWTQRAANARSNLLAVACKANSQRVVAMGVWSTIVQSDNIAPTITVTNPDFLGGKEQVTFKSGTTVDITWSFTGTVGNLTLEYSTKGAGGTYTTIAESVPATAAKYSWTVPNITSTNCIIRVCETDGEPLTHSAPFTISSGSINTITITSPNGGEELEPGSQYQIKWTGSITFEKVDIEYFNGSQWVVIVNGTADDGSYTWTVPAVATNQARLWMKGWHTSGNATDYTDGTFSIGNAAEINITAPNGGELLTGGSAYTIRWQGTVTFDKIDLEYNNGSQWVKIIYGAADVGTYSWTVPNISTTKAKVWVKGWSSSGDPADFSDSTFSIIPAPSGSITVTSPNGGEVWAKSSTENITWSSSGQVGSNVKISYSMDNGFNWTTIVSSTANDASYPWTLPEILADNCLVKVTDTANSLISDVSNGVFSIGGPPQIALNKTRFNFGYIKNGASPCVQTLFISNGGGGTLNWTAAADAPWINLNPTSGTGGGTVTIAINTPGLNTGSYTGTITVSDPDVGNSPQTAQVYLTVKNSNQDQMPFGTFATPVDGLTGVAGSIAVTGWVLDDTCVESVKIYRQVNGGLSFIGDAIFVEGARPDVEQAYPDYPNNSRAGWGLMVLTNFLPDGQLVLKAIARDNSGQQVELGTKIITVDNAHAVKPFGAIDTPGQGGGASGTNFRNNGWALTPQPNKIPEDGHTINVFIDGVLVDNCRYNLYRSDIANFFPGYANANGSWAYLDFDTTAYANGVHTIAWSVTDNAENTDGVGSRYFSIQNTGGVSSSSAQGMQGTPAITTAPGHQWQARFTPTNDIPGFDPGFIQVNRGYNQERKPQMILPDEQGAAFLETNELERIEIRLNKNISRGFLVVGNEFRPLPIGSTLVPGKGIFYWQPGPGFSGNYELVFIGNQENGTPSRMRIDLKINPAQPGK